MSFLINSIDHITHISALRFMSLMSSVILYLTSSKLLTGTPTNTRSLLKIESQKRPQDFGCRKITLTLLGIVLLAECAVAPSC